MSMIATSPDMLQARDVVTLVRSVVASATGSHVDDGDAACELERRAADHPELAENRLVARLGLSGTELRTVRVLAAIALDPETRRAVQVHAGTHAIDPTLDTVRRLVYGADPSLLALRELAADSTLRRMGVMERSDQLLPTSHESSQTWALSRRVLSFLLGEGLDQAASGASASDLARFDLDADATRRVEEVLAGDSAIIVVTGARGSGRETILSAAAAAGGLETLKLDAAQLPSERLAFERRVTMFALECRLRALVPLIEGLDELGDRLPTLVEVCRQLDGHVLATSRSVPPESPWNRPVVCVPLPAMTCARAERLWERHLRVSREDAARLGATYPLAPQLIESVSASARARCVARSLTITDVRAAMRELMDPRLAAYARRLEVSHEWADIVLSEEAEEEVSLLLATIEGRRTVCEDWGFAAKLGKGTGVTALFSGPPGTGKTMVAGVLGNELGLDVYQVDVARIVSKYIGESEKALATLFDAAEAGRVILLFDEADSLFAKRTEVKGSNDRYANLETNYLLQRLESFTGVCVLTSNHEANVDPAFRRRFTANVRLELPDEEERGRLWRLAFPAQAPARLRDDDAARLARRFAMSGGHIKNAALRAAYLAAARETSIDLALLEQAAQLEYQSIGKLA